MKTLGIVTFIFGLGLALLVVDSTTPSNPAAHFGLMIVSKSGLVAGLALAVVGLLVVQRSRHQARS